MKRLTILPIAVLAILALTGSSLFGPSFVSAVPPDTETSYHEGSVTDVDYTARLLTIQDADGNLHTWQAAETVDLDSVQVGDFVRAETRDSAGIVMHVAKIESVPQESPDKKY